MIEKDYTERLPLEIASELKPEDDESSNQQKLRKNKQFEKKVKIITKNIKSNTIGILLDNFGILVSGSETSQYTVGNEAKLVFEGTLGKSDFKVVKIK